MSSNKRQDNSWKDDSTTSSIGLWAVNLACNQATIKVAMICIETLRWATGYPNITFRRNSTEDSPGKIFCLLETSDDVVAAA